MNVKDALQMCSAPSSDFTGAEWCYAANTLAQEVQQLQDSLRLWWDYYLDVLNERDRLRVALERIAAIVESEHQQSLDRLRIAREALSGRVLPEEE